MRLLPGGRDAVLLEFEHGAEVARYAAGLERAGLPGVTELVPAARTLLVRAGSPEALRDLIPALRVVTPGEPAGRATHEVVVEVTYDGPDLDDVAALRGTSREAVVAAHTGQQWTAAFSGFAPGFAYLTSLPDGPGEWNIPRLDSPRPRVPAGSVALAGPYCGCYPTDSPGGWRLIGRTDARLWDVGADPPALLIPGRQVRFVDVTGRRARTASGDHALPGSGGPHTREATLEVLATGPRTLVEDLGRIGHAALGVGRAGAADQGAHRLANRVIGNDEAAATLEVLAGGLALRVLRATVLAVAGAPVACAVDGRPAPFAEPIFLRAGAELRLGQPRVGLRSYVAVLGGVAAPPVLGSRSYDSIAHLGPAPLAVGDLLATGTHTIRTAETGMVGLAVGPVAPTGSMGATGPMGSMGAMGPADEAWTGATGAGREAAAATAFLGALDGRVPLRGMWGPRADWFGPAARRVLTSARWSVQPDSDRVGVRCAGPTLERLVTGELPSEPVVRGSIQIPPSGQPVIFLADAPTTGGYPVIGVLDPAAVDALAQARPGDNVRIALSAPPYPCDLTG